MSGEAKQAAQGLRNATVILLSFIGLLASITTVLSYLKPDSQSALQVQAHVNRFHIPQYVARYFSDESSARYSIKNMMKTACAGMDSNTLIKLSNSELEKVSVKGKRYTQIESCRDMHATDFLARWSNSFATNDGSLITYKIENVGSNVAKDIQIEGSKVNSAEIKRGSNDTELVEDSDAKIFRVPDLNPHESIEIYLWTNSAVDDYQV